MDFYNFVTDFRDDPSVPAGVKPIAWQQDPQNKMVWRGFRYNPSQKVYNKVPAFFLAVLKDDANNRVGVVLYPNLAFNQRVTLDSLKAEGAQPITLQQVGTIDESFNGGKLQQMLQDKFHLDVGPDDLSFGDIQVGATVKPVLDETFIHFGKKRLVRVMYKTLGNRHVVLAMTLDLMTREILPGDKGVQELQLKTTEQARTTFVQYGAALEKVGYKNVRSLNLNVDVANALGPAEQSKMVNQEFANQDPKAFFDDAYSQYYTEHEKAMEKNMGLNPDEVDFDAHAETSNGMLRTALAPGVSQWTNGQLPNAAKLAPFIGQSSVEASQIAAVFNGTNEAITAVNQWNGNLLRNIAYIYNTQNSVYGVYVPALDYEIRKNVIEMRLTQNGYEVTKLPDGGFQAHSKDGQKSPEAIQQEIQQMEQQLAANGGHSLGINIDKILTTTRQNCQELGVNDEKDWRSLAIMNLGGTIVHEATHAQGHQDEGAPVAAENAFKTKYLENLNQKRKQEYEQKAQQEGNQAPYRPLFLDFSHQVHAKNKGWYRQAQFGAQFTLQKPQLANPPPPQWTSVIWNAGAQSIEANLTSKLFNSEEPRDNVIEKRMRDYEDKHEMPVVDVLTHTEELLADQRSPLQGYQSTEQQLEGRRPAPLALPPLKTAGNQTVIKTADFSGGDYENDDFSIGYGRHILPMSDRVIDARNDEDQTKFDWNQVKEQSRYRQNTDDYDCHGFFYVFKDLSFTPELADKMMAERRVSAPQKLFGSTAEPSDIQHVAGVLDWIHNLIDKKKMKGTRLLLSLGLLPFVGKFFANTSAKVIPLKGLGNEPKTMTPVWVVEQDTPKDEVVLAESWANGTNNSEDAQKRFDDITQLSAFKKEIIEEILGHAKLICHETGIQDAYVVGGFPRSLVMGEAWGNIRDLDFSSGWPDDCLKLGGLLAESLGVEETEFQHRSMTLSWNYRGVKCDFRGKSNLPEMRDMMRAQGIATTPLNLDVYSRDLTINMLIYNLADDQVYDVIKQSKKDLANKLLRTYFDPQVVIQRNPLIILRVLKYAARYGFAIDPVLSDAMQQHVTMLFNGQFHAKRLVNGLNDILREGKVVGLQLIKKYHLEPLLTVRRQWLKQEQHNAITNTNH